jgi:hypothetical protein
MQDLVNAVKIADAEHRLDKNAPPPPPAPPTFPDDPFELLEDGSMPLPIDATIYADTGLPPPPRMEKQMAKSATRKAPKEKSSTGSEMSDYE